MDLKTMGDRIAKYKDECPLPEGVKYIRVIDGIFGKYFAVLEEIKRIETLLDGLDPAILAMPLNDYENLM